MAATGIEASPFRIPIDPVPPSEVIFGNSQFMDSVRQRIDKIAGANIPVLIEGESGTGKDILARLIHKFSPWAAGPFVKVNCPAIPGTLMESELFGYERGAFTGANGSKPGRVEMAHRGTLFLDEISELALPLQSKLLQLLQEGQFCRIGANEDRKVEARIVCATNRKLEKEVQAGRFREDLFYRINVVNISVCALRERIQDLSLLTNYFIESYNEKYNRRAQPLGAELIRRLQSYPWPGNIRELENLIRRYVIFGTDDVFAQVFEGRMKDADAPSDFFVAPEITADVPISLKVLTKRAVRDMERQIILKALQAHNWNRRRTALSLRISYRALLYKIRDAGLPFARARKADGDFGGEAEEFGRKPESEAMSD